MKISSHGYLRTRKSPLSPERHPDSGFGQICLSRDCALHVWMPLLFCCVRVESERKEFEFRGVFQRAFHNTPRPITR